MKCELQNSRTVWIVLLVNSIICNCAGYRSLFDISPTTLSLVNLQTELQPLQTGFLVGSAGENAARVEISLDGGAYQAADGTTSWRYALPMAARQWRLNSVHTIAIRAVNGSGNVVAELTRRVRKDHNRDLNGDGYPEMGITGHTANGGAGKLYLYYGGTEDITNIQVSAIAGAATSDQCYTHILADLNYDGYGDLVLGCDSNNSGAGRIGIFNGHTDFKQFTSISEANLTITGNAGDAFGIVTGAADYNADGYVDLAVGAGGFNSGDGKIYGFYGTANGIVATTVATADFNITGVPADNGFGGTHSSGDFNGDGIADLAVSSIDYGGGNGRSYIFYGTGSGISSGTSGSANRIIDGEGIFAYFGSHSISADFNADGYDDLLLGAPRYNIATSKSYLFYGSATGINTSLASSADAIFTGETNSALGFNAAGDLNGDGITDILLGGPKWNNNDTGKIIRVLGQSAPLASANAASLPDYIVGVASSTQFARSAGIWYRDGSGKPDLVVGAAASNAGDGLAYLFQDIQSNFFSGNAGSASHTFLPSGSSEFFGILVTGSTP